jgi:hypothetical protein
MTSVLAASILRNAEAERLDEIAHEEDEASFAAQLAQHNLERPWYEEQECSEIGLMTTEIDLDALIS